MEKRMLSPILVKHFILNPKNPYPYIYALWFNNALLGQYGKKVFEHQTKLIDQIIGDDKAPGTLVAAANYQKGMDVLFPATLKKHSSIMMLLVTLKTGNMPDLSKIFLRVDLIKLMDPLSILSRVRYLNQ